MRQATTGAARRIVIVGSYGAGKTTLALALGEASGIPVHHLDRTRWLPNWVQRPREEWLDDLDRVLDTDEWIVEGNFEATLERRLRACEAAIFLDFPLRISAWRLIRRRLRSSAARADLPPQLQERLNLRTASLLWEYARVGRPAIAALLDRYASSVAVVVLRTRGDVDAFFVRETGAYRMPTESVSLRQT